MRFPRIAFALAVALVLIATSAGALDNNRRGFVLGFGLGWGSATQTFEASGSGLDFSASTTTGGLATDFRIGHGFNERWLLYYTNQQVFFGLADVTFAQGLTGVGATVFLRDQAPSLLFDMGLGVGVLADLEDGGSESGFGLLLGFGYEFARHFQIKADWYYADIGKDYLGDTELKASIGTFRITLNWLGY